MDISSAVAIAVQKMTQDVMRSQGAQISAMIAQTPTPQASVSSVNAPSQGTLIDALA